MGLNKLQALELERIRGWACCLEPERRFMAEVKVAKLEAELEQRRTQIAHLQPVYLEVCEENEALRELIGRLERANSAEFYEGGTPSWNLKSPLQKEIDALLAEKETP